MGRPCACGPLGFRASVEDAQHHDPVLGPVVPTLDDARAWQREQSVAMQAFREVPPPGDTVADVVDEFLEAARAGDVADARGVTYVGDELRDLRWSLRGYVASEIGGMGIAQLRAPDLRAFISRLDADGLAPARTRAVVTALRALLRYAADKGMVPRGAADPLLFGDTDDLPAPPQPAAPVGPPQVAWSDLGPQMPVAGPPYMTGPHMTGPHTTAPHMTAPHMTMSPSYMTMPAPSPAPPPQPAPPAGHVPEEVIWMMLKIVTIVFALIALVLVAESV
jgi:hypothetical protein